MATTLPADARSTTSTRHRFPGLKEQLSDGLVIHTVDVSGQQPSSCEKTPRKLLRPSDPAKPYLPGQPRIELNEGADEVTLPEYLRKSHLTDELDMLLPYMKYIFVQTPSYRHIMALHHQKAHAREVVVNEHPGLHLVWYYDRIFIKPIPAYFYSQAFWEYIEEANPDVYKAAVGFMRSYYFIIQYQIDFDEACEKKLIPPKQDGTHPSYEEFCKFIASFKTVGDQHVCLRYHYGELRLTRINRTTMLFKRHLAYFHIYPQWGSFLAHILAPVITVFAVASVILNSMQVTLAAQQTDPGSIGDGWLAFTNVSLYFPVIVICLIALVIGIGSLGVLFMGMKDLISAKAVREKKKHGDHEAGEKTHGLIW